MEYGFNPTNGSRRKYAPLRYGRAGGAFPTVRELSGIRITTKRGEDAEPETAKIWTVAEAQAFLTTALTHRQHATLYLMLSYGPRVGEMMGLRWDAATLYELAAPPVEDEWKPTRIRRKVKEAGAPEEGEPLRKRSGKAPGRG